MPNLDVKDMLVFWLSEPFYSLARILRLTNTALIYFSALRITLKYQLNLVQRGQSSNKDTLASNTPGLTCQSVLSTRHGGKLNRQPQEAEHSHRVALCNSSELGTHFILNISALKIFMEKFDLQNFF